jgi:ubiquitin carboxyl-terminal hydrolase 14
MRFFWKETPDSRDHQGVKCKIIRAVRFEDKFDVYDCCTEEVKVVLRTNRLADEKLENEFMEKKRSKMTADAASAPPIPSMGGGASVSTSTSGTGMEVVDDEDAAALAAALAMSVGEEAPPPPPPTPECFNSGVPKNFTGVYELFGVVTHKGSLFMHLHSLILVIQYI